MSSNDSDTRVVSGMRPTGRLHLGQYHGVLKNWLQLQHEYECFFFVADWHALTTAYESTDNIEQHTFDMVVDWLAAGLNPGFCHAVSAVAGTRARRAAFIAIDDHAFVVA